MPAIAALHLQRLPEQGLVGVATLLQALRAACQIRKHGPELPMYLGESFVRNRLHNPRIGIAGDGTKGGSGAGLFSVQRTRLPARIPSPGMPPLQHPGALRHDVSLSVRRFELVLSQHDNRCLSATVDPQEQAARSSVASWLRAYSAKYAASSP